ncbi:MAG TPA: nuclear transport factor 2 family protein [Pyrinomonadaceae bacterium]|nr:nuclear transport factor 2 family protein [Pyrinomonadaceae bacterium]
MRHRMMLAACVLFIATGATGAQNSNSRDTKNAAAIKAVLDEQTAAWNRGDIDNFMAGYDRSEKTVFVGGATVTRGWQTVLERYKKNYDTREKMGTLSFSDVEITPLANDTALVLMSWHLQRAKDEPHGRSTLIMRRTKQGWRIVYDHSSGAGQ